MKYHTLQWFQNRRGKFIYRAPIKTIEGKRCCDMCEDTKVKIGSKDYAYYVFISQNELGIEYFSSPIKS